MSDDPRSHGSDETFGRASPPGGDWTGSELALGRYRVTEKLGEGGFGVVYRARDCKLDREVVVKVPHAHLLGSPGFVARFAREIHSLVELDHPRICPILDADEHQGVPYALVKYLAGGSLQDRRPKDPEGRPVPVPLDQVLAWMAPVAEALDFVHGQHYVHRDVKPANILFDAHGNVYLSDFGIAKALSAEADTSQSDALTATGAWIGTPAYMAHEVFLGQKHLPAADQYALAVVIYELLSGRRPYLGPATAIAVLQVAKPPAALNELVESVAEGVAEAVRKALSNDPKARYGSCRDLLKAVETGRPPVPTPPSPKPAPQPEPAVLECPGCGKRLRIEAKHTGQEVSCPGCKVRLQVSRDGHELSLVVPAPRPRSIERAITNSIGMKLVLIPAGEFLMGSPDSDVMASSWEKPQHRVRITRPFFLGVCPVTVGQFEAFVKDAEYKTEGEKDGQGGYGWDGKNWVQKPEFTWRSPGFKQADEHPVVNVSWNDARAFCEWLGDRDGVECRLPTEAQWEYACRAGSTTRWCFGDDEGRLVEHAWFFGNSGSQTRPVGQKKPNAWDLYDMHGNVWEWCEDWSGEYPKAPADDPTGPSAGSLRIFRGGGMNSGANSCRSACRDYQPGLRNNNRGFRVAQVPADD